MLKNRNIPFGYCVINGCIAINENEAEAVRKIFAEYIGGKSLKTIAAEMQIPYNMGKEKWNKNMVSRVLENAKYIGENGFPKIISKEDFEQVAQIKSELCTYRKPAPQADLEDNLQVEIPKTEYIPTKEIQRITNEINRLLDTENSDKKSIEELILKCAEMKYSATREV